MTDTETHTLTTHTRTHTHTHILSHTVTHTHTQSHTHSHTVSHTHTHTLSLTHTHTHTHTRGHMDLYSNLPVSPASALTCVQRLVSRTVSACLELVESEFRLKSVLSHSGHARLFVTPWTVARQAPLSMGFSRHEY